MLGRSRVPNHIFIAIAVNILNLSFGSCDDVEPPAVENLAFTSFTNNAEILIPYSGDNSVLESAVATAFTLHAPTMSSFLVLGSHHPANNPDNKLMADTNSHIQITDSSDYTNVHGLVITKDEKYELGTFNVLEASSASLRVMSPSNWIQ